MEQERGPEAASEEGAQETGAGYLGGGGHQVGRGGGEEGPSVEATVPATTVATGVSLSRAHPQSRGKPPRARRSRGAPRLRNFSQTSGFSAGIAWACGPREEGRCGDLHSLERTASIQRPNDLTFPKVEALLQLCVARRPSPVSIGHVSALRTDLFWVWTSVWTCKCE